MTDSSNSPSGQRPYSASGSKPYVEEKTLRTDRIQVERKTFSFVLKENVRGRFVRITEEVSGQRDTIIVPVSGLADFSRMLNEMAKVAGEGAAASATHVPRTVVES